MHFRFDGFDRPHLIQLSLVHDLHGIFLLDDFALSILKSCRFLFDLGRRLIFIFQKFDEFEAALSQLIEVIILKLLHRSFSRPALNQPHN